MSEHGLLSAAFEHEGALRALLWRLTRNYSDVDDLLQETYIRLLHRSTNGIRNVRGYAMRTAFNVARDRRQSLSIIPIDLIADMDALEDLNNEALVENVISQQQEMERLVHAIKRLPQQTQLVFVLSKVYGFSHQEIKERTRLPQSKLERRLTDAVICLSAILGRDLSTYGKRNREGAGGEHAWERDDYDPSVGLFGGRTCQVCGKTDEDRSDDEIDF